MLIEKNRIFIKKLYLQLKIFQKNSNQVFNLSIIKLEFRKKICMVF